MSSAFHPATTRTNNPDWLVDPVIDWERTRERKTQRRGLRHAAEAGSGVLDIKTPEPFTWVKQRQKRNPNITTQRINQSKFEDSIVMENAKISRKIKLLRGVRSLLGKTFQPPTAFRLRGQSRAKGRGGRRKRSGRAGREGRV